MNKGNTLNMPVKNIIESVYPSLTKAEKKVGNTVLEKLDIIIYHSVTNLADMAEVGETTVLRFCRKIGFKGYQEFKLTIVKDLANYEEKTLSYSYNNDNMFVQNIEQQTIQMIQETAKIVNQETLKITVDYIHKAKNIYLFGVGTSGITALDAKNRLLRIGIISEATTDSHFQAMTAATLTPEDVVVGFSVSGSTKDIVDSLKLAKDNGAKIVAITYYARSPITRLADSVLLISGKESPLEGGSLGAKITQLFVIDLLCTGLAYKQKDSALKMKEKTAQSVVNKIY